MINQIRADVYRICHTLGFYLIVLIVIGYSALTSANQIVGGIMVNAPAKSLTELQNKNWNVMDGLHATTLSSSLLLYIFIGIFVIVIGYEFSQKTYKNTLTLGISRWEFVISKYLMMYLNVMLLIFLNYLTSIIVSVIYSRPLGTDWSKIIKSLFQTTLLVSFFISVIFSLAMLVLLMTSSIVVSSIFIVVFPIAWSSLLLFTKIDWLKYLDLFGNAIKLTFDKITVTSYGTYMWVSLIMLIISCILSIFIMKYREL